MTVKIKAEDIDKKDKHTIIELSDTFIIEVDTYNYILKQKIETKKGNTKFKVIGYYSSLEMCNLAMMDKKIKDLKTNTDLGFIAKLISKLKGEP